MPPDVAEVAYAHLDMPSVEKVLLRISKEQQSRIVLYSPIMLLTLNILTVSLIYLSFGPFLDMLDHCLISTTLFIYLFVVQRGFLHDDTSTQVQYTLCNVS